MFSAMKWYTLYDLYSIAKVHELEPLPTADELPPCPSCCPYCKHAACAMSHCQANPYPGKYEKWLQSIFLQQIFLLILIFHFILLFNCILKKACEDEGEHCSYWEKKGHCNDGYAAYMKENCKKSCDTCPGTTEYIPTQPGFPIPS